MAPVCVLTLWLDRLVISQLTAIFLLCGFGWLTFLGVQAVIRSAWAEWQAKQDARRDDWRATHRAHGSLWR